MIKNLEIKYSVRVKIIVLNCMLDLRINILLIREID